jgi:hypothetical protein
MHNRSATFCPNLNHRRSDAPVSHCPQCGDVVNANIHATRCSEAQHDAARRDHSAFCMHCGIRLMAAR